MKHKRTICSECGRAVGLMTQPKLPGARTEYRVAWHRNKDGKNCPGVGAPRPEMNPMSM